MLRFVLLLLTFPAASIADHNASSIQLQRVVITPSVSDGTARNFSFMSCEEFQFLEFCGKTLVFFCSQSDQSDKTTIFVTDDNSVVELPEKPTWNMSATCKNKTESFGGSFGLTGVLNQVTSYQRAYQLVENCGIYNITMIYLQTQYQVFPFATVKNSDTWWIVATVTVIILFFLLLFKGKLLKICRRPPAEETRVNFQNVTVKSNKSEDYAHIYDLREENNLKRYAAYRKEPTGLIVNSVYENTIRRESRNSVELVSSSSSPPGGITEINNERYGDFSPRIPSNSIVDNAIYLEHGAAELKGI